MVRMGIHLMIISLWFFSFLSSPSPLYSTSNTFSHSFHNTIWLYLFFFLLLSLSAFSQSLIDLCSLNFVGNTVASPMADDIQHSDVWRVFSQAVQQWTTSFFWFVLDRTLSDLIGDDIENENSEYQLTTLSMGFNDTLRQP